MELLKIVQEYFNSRASTSGAQTSQIGCWELAHEQTYLCLDV